LDEWEGGGVNICLACEVIYCSA